MLEILIEMNLRGVHMQAPWTFTAPRAAEFRH